MVRRLRDLRSVAARIHLTTLAEQTGISAAHLSRLEKGVASPPRQPAPHRAGLRGSPSASWSGLDETSTTGRAAEAVATRARRASHVLAGRAGPMAVIRSKLPRQSAPRRGPSTAGESGCTSSKRDHAQPAGEDLALGTGDSINFDPSRTHRLANDGDVAATMLIASTARPCRAGTRSPRRPAATRLLRTAVVRQRHPRHKR